jgi:hypothetical protein
MWSIRTKKFFGAIRSNERGQAIVEYVLVLAVVLGMLFVLAKPVIGSLQKKIGDNLKNGFFAEDPSGDGFYYFPLK